MIAYVLILTAQKMKFSIKNFLSKCDQIRKKVLIFCAKSAFFVYFL